MPKVKEIVLKGQKIPIKIYPTLLTEGKTALCSSGDYGHCSKGYGGSVSEFGVRINFSGNEDPGRRMISYPFRLARDKYPINDGELLLNEESMKKFGIKYGEHAWLIPCIFKELPLVESL